MKNRLVRVLSVSALIIVSTMCAQVYAANDSKNVQDTPCNSVVAKASLDCVDGKSDSQVTTKTTKTYKVVKVNGVLRITDESGAKYYKGFFTINGKRYYADSNAKIIVNKFFVVNGKAYISNKNGEIIKGVAYDAPYYYYCDPQNGGAIKTTAGLVQHDGKRYYVTRGGAIIVNKTITVSGKKYITGKTGEFKTGIVYKDSNYYFCDPQKAGAMKTTAGLIQYNGNKYYVKSGGPIIVNKLITVSGKKYITGKTGYFRKGIIYHGSNYYFCDPKKDGAVRTYACTITWNGKRYYINNGGVIAANKIITVSGKKYIAGKNGDFKTGIVYHGSNYYFCDPQNGGVMKTTAGLVKYNGKRYYVKSGGAIIVNKYITVSGKGYITGKTGEFKTGIVYDSPNYYFCDPNNGGAIKTTAGLIQYNGKKYYVKSGGAIIVKKLITVSGKKYITGKTGEFRTGIVYHAPYYYFCDPKNGGAIRTYACDITWNGKKYHINNGGKIGSKNELRAAELAKSLDYSVYNAYKYLAKQPYYRMYVSPHNGKEWFANFGFTNAKGNCYVKTAMLYYTMKAMGYSNMKAIDGYCLGYGGEYLPHGWIEYYSGGKTYIIDPTFENEVGRNGYMIQYGQKGTWKYLPKESRVWVE